MPTMTITFECSQEQAAAVLGMFSSQQPIQPSVATVAPEVTHHSSEIDNVAREFARHVRLAADTGYPSQQNVMKKWLESDGNARWSDLIAAAGVKDRQAYSGVAGSLSKNMKKSKFPSKWYRWVKASDGEWNLVIATELVAPLQHAFAQLP